MHYDTVLVHHRAPSLCHKVPESHEFEMLHVKHHIEQAHTPIFYVADPHQQDSSLHKTIVSACYSNESHNVTDPIAHQGTMTINHKATKTAQLVKAVQHRALYQQEAPMHHEALFHHIPSVNDKTRREEDIVQHRTLFTNDFDLKSYQNAWQVQEHKNRPYNTAIWSVVSLLVLIVC